MEKKSVRRSSGYGCLLAKVSGIIHQGRSFILSQINTAQVITYWLVGRRIVEFYQEGRERASYGEQLVYRLASDLSKKHGKGFSQRNLEMMRMFYLEFPISQTLSAKLKNNFDETVNTRFKLSWSHYCELLKEDDLDARSFYEIEAIDNGWSMRELRRQMDALLYERLRSSRDQAKIRKLASQGQIIDKPEDVIKDPYILEFLDLKEENKYSESQLEQAVIDNLQHFLLEMGKGFTFVARQKRITMINRHYFIDLVLYNRFLQCFVLIDFKSGELNHADAGQMNFYLNYFREHETSKKENPPIGIIPCSKKSSVYAKYFLGNINNKIFASKYKLKLPTEKELIQRLRHSNRSR